MNYANPLLPPGLVPFPNAKVTQPMSRWAMQIDNAPSAYPMNSITVETFGAQRVAARVEWHRVHYQGGQQLTYPPHGPWWGITLYDATNYDETEPPPTVPPAPELLEGVDVSVWQGLIDWSAVAAGGMRFAYIRVSDGLELDTRFEENWTNARGAIARGVYQYFEPNADPVAQAQLLLAHVQGDAGELAVAVDLERLGTAGPADLASRVSTWIDAVAGALAQPVAIYCSPSFWKAMPVGCGLEGKACLWIAEWNAPRPNVPSGWPDWYAWQYASGSRVKGIAVPVDVDRLNAVELPGQSPSPAAA